MYSRLSLFIIGMLTVLPLHEALRCVNCKGCLKFEDSQVVTCPGSADRCLKLHLPSGLINRECGDDKICQDKKNDGRHLAVHCCDGNVCNGAVVTTRSITTATLLLAISSSSLHYY